MVDILKLVVMWWLSDGKRSLTCLSEMVLGLKTLVKRPICSYFSIVKIGQKWYQMIDYSGGRFRNFIQGLKVTSFI